MTEDNVERSSNIIVNIMFISILLAVMLLAIYITVDAVSTASKDINGAVTQTGTVLNESHYANGTAKTFDLAYKNYLGYAVTCSSLFVVNRTDGTVIASGNYSVSACTMTILTPITTGLFNNTYWNVSYNYAYDINNATGIGPGLTGIKTSVFDMVNNFFALAPTIGTILAVVILIAGIVILVLYVKKMKGSESSEGSYTG
jgi:uncharacterized membrane protein